MYAIRVIPITRSPQKGQLTFFSRDAVPEGALITVPIRKKMLPALTLTSTDVRQQKLDLKAADFSLKRIGRAEPRKIFSSGFMHAVQKTAAYHVAEEGAVLAALTFAPILQNARKVERAPEGGSLQSGPRPEVLVLQADTTERISMYKNLVRESFARKHSLMIIAPSLTEVQQLVSILGRGIEERVISLTSEATPKQLVDRWNGALTAVEPVVVIGTPPALSLPLPKCDALIVERESARAYKSRERPYIDMRRAAEYVAAASGARLILADYPVRVETRYRVESHTAEDLARPQLRPSGTAAITIMDVRKTDVSKKERRSFSPLSLESLTAIEEATARGGRAVVFAARRGIAPLTVCNDCGTPITDPATGAPMVLHKTQKGNAFISHRSGAVVPANISCSVCGGWNLVTLGIGVDRVHDELVKRFPSKTVILFTQDTAPTHRTGEKLRQQFYGAAGTILVGTERMLPYIAEPVECIVVASIDSMLSLSAWRADEHTLSLLYYLRARTLERLIVETRKPDHAVLKSLESGNSMDFYRTEIADRVSYEYPPASVFVGLTWSGTESVCRALHTDIVALLKDFDVVGPLPPEVVDRNRLIERAVVRVRPTEWPHADLLARLKSLPPSVTITVDPDDIV